jgi:hypothetical protein
MLNETTATTPSTLKVIRLGVFLALLGAGVVVASISGGCSSDGPCDKPAYTEDQIFQLSRTPENAAVYDKCVLQSSCNELCDWQVARSGIAGGGGPVLVQSCTRVSADGGTLGSADGGVESVVVLRVQLAFYPKCRT